MKRLFFLLLLPACTLAVTAQTTSEPVLVADTLLTPDAVPLNEVIVTATRPLHKLKGGRLETRVHNTLLATLNNADEVLKHIPGIRYSTDEGYSVFGKGTPIFYIDNRRVDDVTELSRLTAGEIDKIELITNPGAEYDATVKAVVRIRTTKGRTDGWGGSLQANVIQGRRTAHSEQLNLNYQQGGLSLLGSLYGRYENMLRYQHTRYEIIPAADTANNWDIQSHSRLHGRGWMGGAKASLGYDFNPNHSLGFSYNYSRTPGFHLDVASNYYNEVAGKQTDQTDYASQEFQQDKRHQLNAYYIGKVHQWQINFTADMVYGNSNDHQEAQEESKEAGNRDISSFNSSRNRLHAAKLVLTRAIGKGEFTLGGDYTFIRRRDSFRNLQGILPLTDSRIDEGKAAAFAAYTISLGAWSLGAGLRYEHADSHYYQEEQLVGEQSRTYNDWCPNVTLDFPIGKMKTNLSYTVKTNRPSFFALRSTLSYNNRFLYEGGNPLLQPETIHDVQWTALYRWIQGGVSYQYLRNAIAFQSKTYAEDPNVVIFTSDNFPKIQYLNAHLNLSPVVGIWHPQLGIYYAQPFFTVTNQGEIRRMNKGSIYLSAQNSFRLKSGWVFSLDTDYQSEGNFGATLLHSYWGMDVSVRKSFINNRLMLSLKGSDVWHSRLVGLQLFGSRLTYSKDPSPDSRRFTFTVSYRFNASDGKAYKGKSAAERDINRL